MFAFLRKGVVEEEEPEEEELQMGICCNAARNVIYM
jgi:hypothetical protein